jgi:hypothetical protein
MKNTLAENLLRFGVKNLKDADKTRIQHLSEIAPGGSTISPETQKQIDAMIAASSALVAPIRGLAFTGTGKARGVGYKVSDVNIGRDQYGVDIYVKISFGGSSFEIYVGASTKDKKTPVIARKGSFIGDPRYAEVVMPITGRTVFETASAYPWVLNMLAYDENKTQWDSIAAAITKLGQKYIATGIATNESRIYEIAPGGSTVSPEAQAQMDKLIASTEAPINSYITTNKIKFEGPGQPFTVTGAKLTAATDSPDLTLQLTASGWSNSLFFYLQANDAGTDLNLQLSGKRNVPVTQANVYQALIWTLGNNGKQYIDKYVNGMNKQKELAAAGQPNPLDQLVGLIQLISSKWKSGTMATRG